METKELKNTNIRPRKAISRKEVDHIKIKSRGKPYDTQFSTGTGER